MSTPVLSPDVAEHIGDGSAHVEHMPPPVVAVLAEIAEARRTADPARTLTGLVVAYRAVLACRFTLQPAPLTVGVTLIDTWTGDDLAHHAVFVDALDQLTRANDHTVRVFTDRVDVDVQGW